MTTTIETATRCERCERVGYRRVVTTVGVLCPRCLSDLGELLRSFMRAAS